MLYALAALVDRYVFRVHIFSNQFNIMKLKLSKTWSVALAAVFAVCGSLAQAKDIAGNVVIDSDGELAEGLYIGKDADGNPADGSLEITNGAYYDTSVESDNSTTRTVQIGTDSSYGVLTVKEKSTFIGAGTNFWLYNGEVNVQDATAKFCAAEGRSNYRALIGLSGGTASINVSNGGTVINSSAQFVTNFSSGTTVNIRVDGMGSSFTQTALTATTGCEHVGNSGEWVYRTKGVDGWIRNSGWYDKDSTGASIDQSKYDTTITYLCDSGTDQRGKKSAARDNCTTNISATNGGKVEFQSTLTYIGSFQDKENGCTNKAANLTVGTDSSMSFERMAIYADTNIDNDGSFTATDITLHDGATLTYTGIGEFEAASLTVKEGAELSLVFGESVEEVVTFALTRDGGESPATMMLDTMLTLESGSVLNIDGGVLDLGGKALTIADGAIINVVGLTDSDADGVVNVFNNVGSYNTQGGEVSVKLNGVYTRLSYSADGSVIVSAAVPEPTTATLSLLALAGLAARRRRK